MSLTPTFANDADIKISISTHYENMQQTITVNDYCRIQSALNDAIHEQTGSVNTAIHLFNALLFDAIAAYDKRDSTSLESDFLDPCIELNTQPAFTTCADPQQIKQQQTLTKALQENSLQQFHLLNALYSAPLAFKDDKYSIPQAVLSNYYKMNHLSEDKHSQANATPDFYEILHQSKAMDF